MKPFVAVVISALLLPLYAQSNWDKCKDEINGRLNTPREQTILRKGGFYTELSGIDLCSTFMDLGQPVIEANYVITIHEAVHIIDLGLTIDFYKNPTAEVKNEANLFLVDQSRLKPPKVDLPTPYSIFEESGASKSWIQFIKSSQFAKSTYEGYILDREAMASVDVVIGFGSELNAYAHGAMTGHNLLPLSKENLRESPGMLFVQRAELIAFMNMTIGYFDLLKKQHADEWQKVVNSPELKKYYGTLLDQGFNILVKTKVCERNHNHEDEFVELTKMVANDEMLKTLGTTFNRQQWLTALNCPVAK